MAYTVAHYNMDLIVSVKSFIVLAPGVSIRKTLQIHIVRRLCSKLVCLFVQAIVIVKATSLLRNISISGKLQILIVL